MSTSTPPAWHWLEEKYVPVTTDPGYYPADVDEMCHEYGQMREEALSEDSRSLSDSATLGVLNDSESPIGSRKTPESATLRERNGDDPTGEDVWPLERAGVQSVRETPTKLRVGARNEHPECDCTALITESVICAVPSHPACELPPSPDTAPSGDVAGSGDNPAWVCSDCGQDRYGKPIAISTWHTGKCGICGATTAVTEPRDFGASCTAAVSQTGNAPDTGIIADTFSVPFKTQEFMFEELCEEKLAELPQLIDDHHDLIIEMARDRFRKGFAKYGSAMYAWTPERRLDETLQELADAVVYPTSGPVE